MLEFVSQDPEDGNMKNIGKYLLWEGIGLVINECYGICTVSDMHMGQ